MLFEDNPYRRKLHCRNISLRKTVKTIEKPILKLTSRLLLRLLMKKLTKKPIHTQSIDDPMDAIKKLNRLFQLKTLRTIAKKIDP